MRILMSDKINYKDKTLNREKNNNNCKTFIQLKKYNIC